MLPQLVVQLCHGPSAAAGDAVAPEGRGNVLVRVCEATRGGLHQAQCALLQKLGVVASSLNVDSETVRKYKSIFQTLLSALSRRRCSFFSVGNLSRWP